MATYINNVFAAILLSSWSTAPIVAVAEGKVQLEITGFKSNKGQVMLKVYRSSEGFPREDEKAYKIYFYAFTDLHLKVTLALPQGEYAIVVCHDKNGNKKVDTNFIGIPKEPLGVSNYPKLAKPNYEKAKFWLSENDTVKLSIPVDTIL